MIKIKIKTDELSAKRDGAMTSDWRGRFCDEKRPVKTECSPIRRSKMPEKTLSDAFRRFTKGGGKGKNQEPSVQHPERPAETASPTRRAVERSLNVIEMGRKFASCSPLVRINFYFFYAEVLPHGQWPCQGKVDSDGALRRCFRTGNGPTLKQAIQ
jgi:hypothetical protein